MLLRPLPYPAADRIVRVGTRGEGGAVDNVGWQTWADWRERTSSFSELAVLRSWSPTLVDEHGPERLAGLRVSSSYFRLLGVRPALGRDFRPAEDAPDRWHELVIGDGLWRRRFGADPEVVGRTVRMNDVDYTVVGVLPASFEPLVSAREYEAAEIWAPLGYGPTLPWACRSCQHLKALGRLAPGVSAESAVAELEAVAARLAAEHPADGLSTGMAVVPLEEVLTRDVRPALLVLLAAVGFVLSIACANVASLLLARASTREHEMALRASLGAGRSRLVRQLLTESLVLALAGGCLGVLLAAWGDARLVRLAPAGLPRAGTIGLDGGVLAFALVLSLVTGVAFGLVPALRASRPAPGVDLGAGRRAAGARSRVGGGALVVADLALALVLLAGAALMLRSVERLLAVDPGFDPRGVVSLQFSLVGQRYADDAQVRSFFAELLPRAAAVPGVEAVALTGQVPLGGNGDRWGTEVEAHPLADPAALPSLERYSVTPDYFRVLRIPLRRGRTFGPGDGAPAPPVAVVSDAAARRLWPGEEALGQRLRIGGPTAPWRTVVGVVGEVHHHSLEPEDGLQLYLPQAQLTDSFLTLVARTRLPDPTAVAAPLRDAVWSLDRAVPVDHVAPLTALVRGSSERRRFLLLLLALFAAAAVAMAAVGLYGVVAFMVSRRTREVGVRMALGARAPDVVRLVLGAGVLWIAAGLALGLGAALGLTRFLRSQLFEVSATDPVAFAAVVALLAAVALAAHVLPVARALRVDPATALRHE